VTFDQVKDFVLIFTSILYEALPFIVLGAIIAGILEEMVPQQLFAQIMRGELKLPVYLWPIEAALRVIARHRPLAICLGALLGLLFPMCECGIIPVMRRLLRKGLPLSCCTAYLLAGPIINVVVILSTAVAFTGQEQAVDSSGALTYQMGSLHMTIARMLGGFLVAVGTSLVVDWQQRVHGNKKLLTPLAQPPEETKGLSLVDEDNGKPRKPWRQRLAAISETALHDFVDIMVFLILGAVIAAGVRQVLTHEMVAELSRTHWILAILLMMGLAILLCLCSEADAFIAASFISLRPAAKVAFLVLGPMLDIKLFFMYTRVFRPRLIYTIIICVVVQVFIYASLVHYVWENFAPYFLGVGTPGK
jgi:uncharacterized membrane protein YraQ (UPF0718 family)